MEIWKDVKGYEGCYQVSSLGRVKSLSRKVYRYGKPFKTLPELIIKERISKNGYAYASLSNDGKKKNFAFHRLVAIAFIDNKENKPDVNHKDHNKLNNILENIEWATKKENARYVRKIKLDNRVSKYKGVSCNKYYKIKKWYSRIRKGDKKICLGYFKTEKEAAIAYNIAATKHFGKFALLNEF